MKKILVTGGAGYIGAHTVVELHQSGYRGIIIDNFSRSDETLVKGIKHITDEKPTVLSGDCSDLKFLETVFNAYGPFEAVMHFAAFKSVGESVANPLGYYENNVGSMVELLRVMQANNIMNLIFSSSCTVYGQPDIVPVDEQAPFKKAESPYGATKQMCERILEDVSKIGFRIISLRYFNPIGAHPSSMLGELPVGIPNNLVPYITQTAAGIRKSLNVFGNDYDTPDGTCIRDFIHVVDLAIAHVKAMEYLSSKTEKNIFEAFNLGTGKGVSVLELVNTFMKVTNVKLPFEIVARRPGDVEKVYGDPSKANRVLNWKTNFSLEESLVHAWRWEKKLRGIH
jgi:UDP-glucose 4-epimerase